MKNRTKKRARQERQYNKIKPQNDLCFFCGRTIVGRPDKHHLDGRDGDLLTKEEWIFNVHRQCHDIYHHGDYMSTTWYRNFMKRLKEVDETLYYRHKLREDKRQ